MITIRPQFSFNQSAAALPTSATATELPFAWVSAGNSSFPYQTAPTNYATFNELKAISVASIPDACRVEIVLTQNQLNLQGRVTLSYF